MNQLSNKLSRKIIQFLKDEKKLDEKQIAKLAGTTPKFITEIVEGDKAFKQSQMDKIQKEYDVFFAMAPELVSELIATKTKTSREFVKEKTQQGKTLLKKSTNSLMQFICNLAAEHSEK